VTDAVEPPVAPPVATVVSGGGIRAFTPAQIAFATFLGSPLAGGVAMAINARRTGRPIAAPMAVGVGLTVVLVAVAMALPGVLGNAVPIAGVMAMLGYAKTERDKQGATVPGSSWGAFGLGIAGLAVAGAAIVGVVLAQQVPHVEFGQGQEVRYTGGATESEAYEVGEELVKLGWFTGQHEATVQIAHAGATLEVSFVLRDGAWDDAQSYHAFQLLRPILANELGKQVSVRLCDDELEMHRVIE
jgi:hypothetical protein